MLSLWFRALAPYITGGLLFLCLMLGLAWQVEKRHSHKLETQLTKCTEGRAADRASYAQAQKDAQALNDQQIQRAKAEQEKISNETVSDLERRLELIRRELRKPGAAAPQSHPASPEAGSAGQAPGGASSEAGMCLSAEERLRSAENEERHDQLITWVERQLGVDPNK
jgi:hypothetical protein